VQTATNPDITTTVAASFPAAPVSARSARHFVTGFIQPFSGREIVDVVALLTTELATNSLLHARSAIEVAVSVSDDEIRVEVSDAHPSQPRRIFATDESTCGRGLELVEHLSDRWGVTPREAGKGVWFSLHR
jgi:anti-sigma regulatory factor (Ser/Thr protein kinase)